MDVDVRFTVQATNIATDDTKYYQLGSITIPARTTSWYPLSWSFQSSTLQTGQYSLGSKSGLLGDVDVLTVLDLRFRALIKWLWFQVLCWISRNWIRLYRWWILFCNWKWCYSTRRIFEKRKLRIYWGKFSIYCFVLVLQNAGNDISL